jgi:lipopolysaccharide export system permease protein
MIICRHILARHAAPFAFAAFVLMFIFLLQFLVKSLDQLAGKGLAPAVIAELIVLSLAWMVVLAIPMAVLVATLMAFGQLASTNQITALRASGVSLYRMIAPVLLAGAIVCVLLVLFNNHVLPDANHRTKILLNDISRKKPTISVMPGMFSQLMPGYTILVRKTFEASNDLEGVTIFDYSTPGVLTTLTGTSGTISFSSDYRKLIMDLKDGEIHEQGNREGKQYRRIRFATHRIAMDAEGFDFQRSNEGTFDRGDRELSAQAMRRIVDSLAVAHEASVGRLREALEKHANEPVDPRMPPTIAGAADRAGMLRAALQSEQSYLTYLRNEMNKYEVEIYKKYAIPFACVVFVLIGAPLGIMARRGTFGAGASLSLGFFLLYWTALIQGERLADRGIVDPLIAMWSANAVIGILGIYLTVRTARESLTLDFSWLQRLVPKSWRSNQD